MVKLSWQDRVKETEKFHKCHIRENSKHTIEDTAKLLRRSIGSISQDLMLSSWFKSHPRIAEFVTMQEALSFVRHKKSELRSI